MHNCFQTHLKLTQEVTNPALTFVILCLQYHYFNAISHIGFEYFFDYFTICLKTYRLHSKK